MYKNNYRIHYVVNSNIIKFYGVVQKYQSSVSESSLKYLANKNLNLSNRPWENHPNNINNNNKKSRETQAFFPVRKPRRRNNAGECKTHD